MNKNGFTLLEVLISLLILTAAVSIFSSIQLRSILRISKEKEYLDRVFIVKDQMVGFIEKLEKKDKKVKKIFKKNIENPNIKITSQVINIDKRSSLRSFNNDIEIVKINGTWQGNGSRQNLSVVTFIKKKDKKIERDV